MKHSNVAIFVPHNGCPHACTFCNQREITGQQYQPTAKDVESAVRTARESLGEGTKNSEIAFFGGSFTVIDRSYMTELLEAASPYVLSGEFAGIRLSTRPDAIDKEVLDILKIHGVSSIELGAQSRSDEVLLMNRRGHTAEDVRKASGLIKEYGFSLGLQMMTGMYGSDDETDKQTAVQLAELMPDTVRIYPTVVLKGTELYRLYLSGEYKPQTVDEAVVLCAELLRYFEKKNINVIRLGLHDSDSLRENMAGGAFHPAFRELCESEIMYRNALSELENRHITAGCAEFIVNPSSLSKFIGQKRKNIKRLESSGISVSIKTDDTLSKYEVNIINN